MPDPCCPLIFSTLTDFTSNIDQALEFIQLSSAINFTIAFALTHRARRYKLEPPEPEKGLTSSM